jgi:tRNA G46 methylase TrmB
LRSWLRERAALPLVLDSGCGTGASSVALAAAHPDCAVVGVDQSLARLSRRVGVAGDLAPIAGNAVLLRAPLQDLWRLLLADGRRLQRHLLWYPNPWPKPEHLGRRWHAHPVFPTLLALGGQIELRSNWRVYVDEFALALRAHGWPSAVARVPESGEPATPFERKYRDSGHALWCLSASAPTTAGG